MQASDRYPSKLEYGVAAATFTCSQKPSCQMVYDSEAAGHSGAQSK